MFSQVRSKRFIEGLYFYFANKDLKRLAVFFVFFFFKGTMKSLVYYLNFLRLLDCL